VVDNIIARTHIFFEARKLFFHDLVFIHKSVKQVEDHPASHVQGPNARLINGPVKVRVRKRPLATFLVHQELSIRFKNDNNSSFFV